MFEKSQLIYAYTRADALSDGFQVLAPTDLSSEIGIKYPVFFTRSVWDRYVEVDPLMPHQSLEGRLWDILYMFALRAKNVSGSEFEFTFICQMPEQLPLGRYERFSQTYRITREITLTAKIGPTDIDNPSPAITIMFADED